MPDVGLSSIEVTPELEGASGHMNNVAGSVTAELERLERLLLPLADTWTGETFTYYRGLQEEWNIAADGLFGPEGVLGQIAAAMHTNWGNYSEAEWANSRTWRSR